MQSQLLVKHPIKWPYITVPTTPLSKYKMFYDAETQPVIGVDTLLERSPDPRPNQQVSGPA